MKKRKEKIIEGIKVDKKKIMFIVGLLILLAIILMININFISAPTTFSGTTAVGSYGSGYSGTYGASSFSGVRVYGTSVNPQFNSPGFLSSGGYTPVGVYWPKFDQQDCSERQDMIMQIAPGGCSPAVVRSDLLEEQNVPVFCKVMAVQVNPLIDVSKIRSLRFNGQYPPGVSGISYFPARAAVRSQESLVSSPVKDNLGYVVIVLSRNEIESSMPDFVAGNITAVIDYDIENAFGIGNANFYASEMSDDNWLRDYKEYGFWNGKGYIRADSINSDGATISIYRDADSKQSTISLKKGETSRDVYLGGFYCAAGMNIQLESVDAPVESALLQINDQQLWVARGDRILNNRCTVSELQSYGGGGRLKLSCPVQNGLIDLSLNPGKVTLIVNGNEVQKTVGDKISNDNVYLGYVGQYADGSKYAVLIKDGFSYNEYSFADKDIYSIVDSAVKNNNKKAEDLNVNIKNAVINQYRKKLSGSGFSGKFDENNLKIEIISESNSGFGATLKEVSVAKDRAWNLDNENDKAVKEYYDNAIKYYEDLVSFYPGEKVIQDSNEDSYAAIGLYESAEMSKKIGMNEKAQNFYNRLLKDYPDSNVAKSAVRNQELLMKYDAYNSKAIVNINNDQYFIDVLDFKKPTVEDASAVLMINGVPETLGLNDVKFLDVNNRNGSSSIQLKEIKDDYVTIAYNNAGSAGNYYNPSYYNNYNFASGDTRRINLREQTVFNNVVVNLAEVKLNRQAKLHIVPKAFGPRGESNFNFRIGIEKRGINLSTDQTKSMMSAIDKNIKDWSDINDKLGKVVSGLKGACFATSAVLTLKNLVSGFSGQAMARKEIMTSSKGWNDFCEKLVSDNSASKYTGTVYTSVQPCLLGHGDIIQKDVDAYSNQLQNTNNQLKEIQQGVGTQRTDAFDLQGQTDTKEVENRFKSVFDSYCRGINEQIKLPDKEQTIVNSQDICNWDSMTYDQRKEIMTLMQTRNSGSNVLNDMVDTQLGNTVLTAKNFQEYEGARKLAEQQANELNLGLRTLTPIGDNVVYGDVKRITSGDLVNTAYGGKFSAGDDVVRVFIPIKESLGGYQPFEAKEGIGGKEVLVKVKIDSLTKDYIPDKNADIYTVNGEKVEGDALASVREYMSQAKMNRIKISNAKAYENKMLNPENLKVEYFERAPYKGLPAIVPFDVENGWYVQLEYVLSGFGKPYDDSGRAVNFYICNVGNNGLIEFKKSNDDICRYYNGDVNAMEFPGIAAGESSRLLNLARAAISEAARQYGKKQVTIGGRRFGSGISFGGDDGRCSDFMSPEDCLLMFNVCDPVICPASRCDLGGRFRVDNVIASGVIGSLVLCLPNIQEGIAVPICLSGVYAGVENYLSILTSTRQCLNESIETGRNIGICDEIKSIYLCEFFWKQASPLINVIIPRLIELAVGQGVRGGGEYLTVQSAWDNTNAAIDYFTKEYAVNSMTAFRARTTEEVGSEVCKSFNSVVYPSQSIIDKLIEPDSPVQYSAWFSEDSLTSATIPPTSHYKVYYHIYSGKDMGSYYSVYLKDLPQSNYIYVSGTYIVDSGYITRGSQVDEAKDFTAVSGYKQLCVSVNGQEKCDFGKVSTSYALNAVSDAYAASQIETNIMNQKQCVAGTASLYSLVQPNLQAGFEQMINPQLYNQGIIRVCASQNPGKQVLANGQYDTTQTTYDRWKDVGYCDDPTIRCWLDTSSVKDVIKDKGIENQVLQNVDLNNLGVSGYLTEDSSKEIAAMAEDEINGLVISKTETKASVDLKISGIVGKLSQLINLGTNNVYRARGLYLFGKLYFKVVNSLFDSKLQSVGTYVSPGFSGSSSSTSSTNAAPIPATNEEIARWSGFYDNEDVLNPYLRVYNSNSGIEEMVLIQNLDMKTGIVTMKDGSLRQAVINDNKVILTEYQGSSSSSGNKNYISDEMLRTNVNINVNYNIIKSISGRKSFILVYNSGWLAADTTFNNNIKGKGYVDGINYLVSTLQSGDGVIIEGKSIYRGYSDSDKTLADAIINKLRK